VKSLPALKDELCFLFGRAQLSQWMIGINCNDFRSILPEGNSQDALAEFIYSTPEQWMSDFRFIIDGGVDGDDQHRGSGRDRKKIGAAILTSGMIHVCQSLIYDPDSLGRHVGFAKFINSVKSWSDAGETITLLSDCRFLFISEVYIASDMNKTLMRTVAESFNDLLERRENNGLVTIISIKPSIVTRIMEESDFLGAAITSLLNLSGSAGTVLMKEKRLCRIAF